MSERENRFKNITKIVYIVKMFPRLSETFIVNEILQLEKLGYRFEIYSLMKPLDNRADYLIQSIQSPIHFLPQNIKGNIRKIMKDHWSFLFHQPGKYLLSLFYTVNKLNITALKRFYQAVALAEDIRDKNIRHIHAGFAHTPTTVAMITHYLTGIPYSFTAHAKDLYLSETDSLKHKIESARFVMTCTKYNKQCLDELVTEKESQKIMYNYHGIEPEKFQRNGTQKEHRFRILSIGRLVEKKGHIYLIEACSLLKTWGYNFRCDIVGGGLLRDNLDKTIKEMELEENVELHGAKTQNELMEYYNHADLFVTPCIIADNGDRDGIPNVLMEAMSMEIPVLATSISGIPELIRHDYNGLLVPEKNSNRLAQEIARVIEHPELQFQLGKNGRKTILEKFDASKHIVLLSDIFQKYIVQD